MSLRRKLEKSPKGRGLFIIVVVLVWVGCYLLYTGMMKISRDSYLEKTEIEETARVMSAQHIFEENFEVFSNDIKFIKNLVMDLGTEISLGDNQVEQIFSHYLESHENAFHVRILDFQGKELVRVDLDEGGAVEKKIRDLQDKSDREYYIESMNLEPGEIYFNDFDLNVEHGVIEIPYKPVIRVTTKLENANGNGLRILIVNFSGAKLIDEIHQLTSSKFGNVELINSEGYWLSSNEEYREWGFKFLDKEYLNMANLYHNQWNVMNRYKKGFFKTEQGWMTTLLYKPDDEESHQIFISSNIPETMIDDELGNLRTNTQLIIILVGVTASSLAYFSMKISIARKKHKEQIKRQAHYDTLTGVANRLKFNQDLIEWVDESEKADNMFAVFFMDLDGFKNVNDTFGHEIGDRVLKDVAKRLLHVIRGEDQTYRLGGDEFTIILKRIKEREDVELVAKKIINAVSHPYVYDSEIRCVIGVSIGISIYPFDAKEDNGLINIADDMMYEVKKSGKNNFKYNS